MAGFIAPLSHPAGDDLQKLLHLSLDFSDKWHLYFFPNTFIIRVGIYRVKNPDGFLATS